MYLSIGDMCKEFLGKGADIFSSLRYDEQIGWKSIRVHNGLHSSCCSLEISQNELFDAFTGVCRVLDSEFSQAQVDLCSGGKKPIPVNFRTTRSFVPTGLASLNQLVWQLTSRAVQTIS